MRGPSPLFVWKMISIVIVAASIYMYFSDPMKVVLKRRDEKMIRQFEGVRFAEDELGIIFIGNSLMMTALGREENDFNAHITNEFRKAGISRRASAKEIVGGGVTLTNLIDMEENLISVGASVVVIQSEMIIPRAFKRKEIPRLKDRIGLWSGVIGSNLLADEQKKRADNVDQPRQVIEKDLPAPAKRLKRQEERRRAMPLTVAKRMWKDQVVSTDNPQFMAARNFIQRLTAKGICVAIVELPVSQTAASLSPPDYFTKRKHALQTISGPRVMHFAYPEVLPDRYFLDYRHATATGSDAFLGWFFPLLVQEIVKHGS